MEENTIAVNTTTEAPVTDSAPVETSTVDTSIESSEKTETTSEGIQDGTKAPETKSIPYDRFAEVNEKAKKYEAELAELRAQQESDGMPRFVATEVAAYMDELAKTGQFISDPETAYKLKHLDQIAEARAKQQRSSTYSEKQQGGMNQVNDTRSSELEAATKTGDFTQFLKKFAPMPKA